MTVLSLLFTLASFPRAHAQWQSSHWLHLDGAYAQRETKESERLNLTARRALGRGELGVNLLPHLSVSGVATYQDGAAATTGRTLTGGTPPSFVSGRVFETRALAHLIYNRFVISGGLAQLESADDVSGAYRTRSRFDYKPMMVTVFLGPAYVRVEHDVWTKGSTNVGLSDGGGGRTDLKFNLTKASGQGAEVGVLLPNRLVSTKIFLSYHRLTIDPTAAQSDGVESVNLPETVITQLAAGVGLAF